MKAIKGLERTKRGWAKPNFYGKLRGEKMLFKDLLKEKKNSDEKMYLTLIGDVSKVGVIASVHEDFITLIDEDNEEKLHIPLDSIIYVE